MGAAAQPLIAIRRDKRFSPNSEESDRAILQAVVREMGMPSLMLDEAQFDPAVCACGQSLVLSMARSPQALACLQTMEAQGAVVINSPSAILSRSALDSLMRRHHVAMPPEKGKHGYWLKRGDAAAEQPEDVCFCHDEEELEAAKQAFRLRGLTDWVVSPHMEGDLVKWYAVGDRFFRYYYPNDDGISKFGDEAHNGMARHYPFSSEGLHKEVTRLAHLVGIDVYGGDAIIDAVGKWYIIDFNDWPSFARCRQAAASAIASLAVEKYQAQGKRWMGNIHVDKEKTR